MPIGISIAALERMAWPRSLLAFAGVIAVSYASRALRLAQLSRGVCEDRVHLTGVGQEIGAPLGAIPVVLSDLRQQAFELLHVAGCRLAELRVGAKAAPKLV